MNRLTQILVVSFWLIAGTYNPLQAQPCGVTAEINVYGGLATVSYSADSANFLPGWDAYKYEWWVNNSLFSSFSDFSEWLPSGYNHVCLKVFGTNTSTGDSCVVEHCNVFQSTGDAIYPYFDASVNGLTVNFTGGFYGGYGINPNATYDFGDGTFSSSGSLNESHTYATSGAYTVSLFIEETTPTFGYTSGQSNRKINVDNGQGNIEFSFVSDNTICDSVSVSSITIPAYTSGSINANYIFVSPGQMVPGAPTPMNMEDTPGHDFLRLQANGANLEYDEVPRLVFINECGVIPDTILGSVYNDINFNGLRDAGEPGLPGKVLRLTSILQSVNFASEVADYYATTDSSGNYSLIIPHQSVNLILVAAPGQVLTFPEHYYAYSYLFFTTGTSHPGFNYGLSYLSTQICGTTYLDDNGDGTFNANSDRRFASVNINVHNNITGLDYHKFSGPNGNYCIDLPPGNFTLRPVYYLLDSAVYSPDSIVINSSGGNFNNNNFGFESPVPGNFEVSLHSSFEARPGFDFMLSSRVHNSGFDGARGTIVLNFDPALTHLSHTPANGVVNTVNHTITWVTDTMNPGLQIHYNGLFNIPASTPLGTLLTNSTSVTMLPGFTEFDLTNNFDTLTKTVIGSYDPNDKSVSPSGVGAAGNTLHDTRMDYRIRFQNTGTASAINVIVTDTIDTDLDLNTFMMHRASHNYELVTNDRILTWKFFNINLPDSNTNEPESHGFIEYSIAPVPGLIDGSEITNSANIYFDYNQPIITNTTLNTMQTVIVSLDENITSPSVIVYPVPANEQVSILPRMVTSGKLLLTLYDITGKKVSTLFDGNYTAGTTIIADLSGIEKGMYLLRMEQGGQSGTAKLVKQ